MNTEASSIGKNPQIYARRELKAIAARWDIKADSWDDALKDSACHLNEDDAYNRFSRLAQQVIARHRPFCRARGIIDVGCGTGLILEKVLPAFSWGIGIDISLAMIQMARAKRLAKAKFIAGDCFDLESLCPKAGAILSRGILLSHYGREQGNALLQAARATLVPGGFALFDFLNEASRTRYRHAPENKIWFTGHEIARMASDAGFSKITILGAERRRARLLLAET